MASRKCILAAESHDSSGNKTLRTRGRSGLSFIVPSDHGFGMDLSSLSTIKIKNLPAPPPLPATAGLRPNGVHGARGGKFYRDNDIRWYRYLRAFIGAEHIAGHIRKRVPIYVCTIVMLSRHNPGLFYFLVRARRSRPRNARLENGLLAPVK